MRLTLRAALLLLGFLLTACGSDQSGRETLGLPAPQLADSPTPQRILVIGGTRGVGLQTVKLALERGHEVTAMARSPEKMTLKHPGLNLVGGSILDAATTEAVIAGMDAVVIAIGMGPTREPVTLFSEGARVVLDGMRTHGVRRLIAVTGIGAGDTLGHGGFFYDNILQPLALSTIYEDKNRQEALIRTAGDEGNADWTIVRPGFLEDRPANGLYRVISDMDGYTAGSISRADVGHFILAAIESSAYIAATPLISE